ncbi:hypothetical protein C5167_017092 [Papaver somniferum]|uniref:N-acetyltransferase domain-containing protein n=1 Tax=Papaver somniferum TaxID=3469 RepID=A0A4Y7IMH4_PAPSO|nr:probable N-acetyltransferase HLS1 [Papaver somniferum]RZC48669.1 hypothetical protein C5167_017092 [Papaver somniferum]
MLKTIKRNMDEGHALYNNNKNKIHIREYKEERDIEVVEKLEKVCETIESCGKARNAPTITNIMGDPLFRIRFYKYHVLLIAEKGENGEVVGVIRGCIKYIRSGVDQGTNSSTAKMGCILGLRVSPKHRRNGIGLKLVKCAANWAIQNGAHYTCMAAEEDNIASTNLFVHRCNYVKLSPLIIFTQPIHSRAKEKSSSKIIIQKLSVEQAISLYKTQFGSKQLFPVDVDAILKQKPSIGTWVSFFKDENWVGLNGKDNNSSSSHDEFIEKAPGSWAMISIWNKTRGIYKLKIGKRETSFLHCFNGSSGQSSLARGGKVFHCFRKSIFSLLGRKSSGFIFVYGLHGEGKRVGELMQSLWRFAHNVGKNVKDCKLIITELGVDDPLREHLPQGPSMSFTNDIWYLKKVNGSTSEDASGGDEMESLLNIKPLTNLFVDPRDF